MRTPDGLFSQRLTVETDREGFFIWACTGCSARVTDGLMTHALLCPEFRSERTPDRIVARLLDSAANTIGGLELSDINEDGHALANRLWRVSGYLRNRRNLP